MNYLTKLEVAQILGVSKSTIDTASGRPEMFKLFKTIKHISATGRKQNVSCLPENNINTFYQEFKKLKPRLVV